MSSVREVFEETGLKVSNPNPIFVFSEVQKEVRHQIWIIYEFEYNGDEIKLNLEEHTEYQWVNIEESKAYPKIFVIEKFIEFLASKK